MDSLARMTALLGAEHPLRTGYTPDQHVPYVVAVDLRKALGFKASTNRFVAALEAAQADPAAAGSAPYLGEELIETPGGVQKMKVLYERGVFQVLMRSELPAAVRYRDQIFGVLGKLDRDGFAVGEDATVEQLEAMEQRARREVRELLERRHRERMDYRSILRAIADAGGSDRDYADVQNMIYLGLFGSTAKTIMIRQKQMAGDTYQRGALKGSLKPSGAAKDHLTGEQLAVLATGVGMITDLLAVHHPSGRATLEDIKIAAWEVGRRARAGSGRTLQVTG